MNWRENLSRIIEIIQNKRNLSFVFGSFAVAIALIISQLCVVFVKTNSVPYSVCLQMKHVTPGKYDLCAFMYKGHKFIKYIIGTEGDTVMNIADAIYVDGFRVGKAERNTQLTPIDDCVIPPGYVFVSGRHPQSLDSRYREFGFIKASNLEGKVFGLVKRDDFKEDTFINWKD